MPASKRTTIPPPVPWDLGRVTLTADDERFSIVAMDLGASAGVSVIVPPEVGEVLVSLDLVDVPGQEAFKLLAEAVKRKAVFRDGVVAFPAAGNVAETFSLVGAAYENPGDVVGAAELILGGDGNVRLIGTRLIVTGTVEGVQRVRELMEYVGEGPDGWVLQVVLVEVSRGLQQSLGLTWNVGGLIGASVDVSTGSMKRDGLPVFGASAQAVVEALADATQTGRDAQVVTMGTLLLLEGQEAQLHQGEVVPIPQRTVSDNGTITTTGFTLQQTGFQLTATGVRVADGLLLNLQPSVSTVVGFVEEAPITRQSDITASAVVDSGDWIVLAGLNAEEHSSSTQGMPGMPASYLTSHESTAKAERTLLVLVRATRVYASGGA